MLDLKRVKRKRKKRKKKKEKKGKERKREKDQQAGRTRCHPPPQGTSAAHKTRPCPTHYQASASSWEI
jgi:hypothetical protein